MFQKILKNFMKSSGEKQDNRSAWCRSVMSVMSVMSVDECGWVWMSVMSVMIVVIVMGVRSVVSAGNLYGPPQTGTFRLRSVTGQKKSVRAEVREQDILELFIGEINNMRYFEHIGCFYHKTEMSHGYRPLTPFITYFSTDNILFITGREINCCPSRYQRILFN